MTCNLLGDPSQLIAAAEPKPAAQPPPPVQEARNFRDGFEGGYGGGVDGQGRGRAYSGGGAAKLPTKPQPYRGGGAAAEKKLPTKALPYRGGGAAAELPTKPPPPGQAVQDGREGAGRGRGRNGPRRDYGGGGYGGGGVVEEGEGRSRGPRQPYRGGGGRRGEGQTTDEFGRPHRSYERPSGTGRGYGMKRDGAGRGKRGTAQENVEAQETAAVAEDEKKPQDVPQAEAEKAKEGADHEEQEREAEDKADPVSKVLEDDNLLIEIILRLGCPTTLVHAALVCKRWLCHASDPAVLRRFRKLHPPRLLGFYLDVFSYSQKPDLTYFVPMLPQPTELAAIARRVASYNFDDYHNAHIEDSQNGHLLIQDVKDDTYKVLSPLRSERAVTIPCPPGYDFLCDHILFKQGSHELFYLLFDEEKGEHILAHVYVLKDSVWCLHTSFLAAQGPLTIRPLLVDNKMYIASGLNDILILDMKDSSFSKICLPEGVKYCRGRESTMFSGTDDDSKVYLIHVKEFQVRIWLHNGDDWSLVDAISLREIYDSLRKSDDTVGMDFSDVVIEQAGENAEFVFLKIGRSILYLDVKCRIVHIVYEENTEEGHAYIYPFMMIWPPTFPAHKDDPSR